MKVILLERHKPEWMLRIERALRNWRPKVKLHRFYLRMRRQRAF